MPKRTDIKKILIIGSGPIIIGQACEFDYSGTQACKSLREEGFEVVLANSNPATIMTDPETAHRTYIEPLIPETIEKIIQKEQPDALLPTMGGQTGLNCAVQLAEKGILDKYGVTMIGANIEAIQTAEDRELFKDAMLEIGLDVPVSGVVHSVPEAREVSKKIGFPCVIRPSFTLGGTGGGICYNIEEMEQQVALGVENSLINEVLIEESVAGWKEFELEVMRDVQDNVVIICSIENFDPMGIHTGDSITVAPAQTLTDKEYHLMRDAAIRVIQRIGVETGGSNIQFAIHPKTGRMVVIEMNPRVSRSSALASKATGFPIAKIAAKLAVGYTLDEIQNDITKNTPACFEPTIDYCVVKFPRWDFLKFPDCDTTLTIQMKSVGETMAIGRTFKEALQKALRGLEIGLIGLGHDGNDLSLDGKLTINDIRPKLLTPTPERILYLRYAMKAGMTLEEIHSCTKIDKWFLYNIQQIVAFEDQLQACGSLDQLPAEQLREAKRMGFSDAQLAAMLDADPIAVRKRRKELGIIPTYKLVDTCAAEFEAYTPYYYSTYEDECEVKVSDKKKIMILSSGPNRIGQGIEFDYCCVHASFALKEDGFETIMVNSNPETVSTDYDTSDILFFEPVTLEDILNIVERINPDGVIVQFGGQTPLNIARALEAHGAKIIGTPVDSIDAAEDRDRFQKLARKLGLRQPENGIVTDQEEALNVAARIGYPVLVRPSYVLGGRAMQIVYDNDTLRRYMQDAVAASPEHPVLIDKYLENATEVDVDCIADGRDAVIAGIMEHIEEAGVHSGDSSCIVPPQSLSDDILNQIRQSTLALAGELKVVGLMNVQWAVQNEKLFILEVNPRASRTVPYISKAIGKPLAKMAARIMAGKTLKELGFTAEIQPQRYAVKMPVFPFSRFPGTSILLSPEMKSTGEIMGIDDKLGIAVAKAWMATTLKPMPTSGEVFISVKETDKTAIIPVARKLHELGFVLFSTPGTAKHLQKHMIPAETVLKIAEGRPHVIDRIINGKVVLVINTPSSHSAHSDEAKIRTFTVKHEIPCVTTLRGAEAVVNGIAAILKEDYSVKALQDYI
ncbi:carbamoyl-phosphate synthase large subunit [Planctomycetota bacterium]